VRIQNVLSRDSIPSIDDPTFSTDYFGDDEDDVIVVETTPARAYPVRILSYHEIVNDLVPDSDSLQSDPGSPGDLPDDSRPIGAVDVLITYERSDGTDGVFAGCPACEEIVTPE
jgi:hypothetical protein